MLSKGDINRQRIVEVADNLFYQKGFENTSFSDISQSAEIARGNFYYYFKTKDDILNAVIEHRINGITHMLHEWDKQFPEPRDRLKRYCKILTNSQDEIEQFGCPVGSLCTELAKLRHGMQENASELFNVFRNWLNVQFTLLGCTDNADYYAMHLMARGQGISTITSAYQDKAFLHREAAAIDQWIDDVSCES